VGRLRHLGRLGSGHREEVVILDIPHLVSRLVPGLLDGAPADVACVRTTQPKYLVFGADRGKPACVVQVGPRHEMERVHAVLARLHPLLPDAVAAPLACVPLPGGDCVQIQSGLPGVPWFRLPELFRSPGQWGRLRDTALATLGRFHEAVRQVPEWADTVRPGDELRRQARICREQSVTLSPRAVDYIDTACERLDGIGELPAHWQHGDFCLNNLLVTRTGAAVIDLDEFGLTSMPLQDRIGLALSVSDLAPGGSEPRRLRANLDACLGRGVGWWDSGRHLPGLFLHYLLWRAGRCHGRPTRARALAFLITAVEEFVTSPGVLFPSSRAARPWTLVCTS
jgi:hypothetical protein